MSATTSAGHGPVNVTPNSGLYRKLWYYGLAIAGALVIVSYFAWSITLFDKFGITFEGGPTAILVDIVFLALSLKEVSEDEVAAAFSYGKALVILSSGLHFVPFGLMRIKIGPRPVQEFQCPGEPEIVFKGDDKLPLPPGMVRAIRVVTGGPKGNNKDMLNTRMTITLSFFVQWAVTDVLDYASNYGNAKEVMKQVRDIGESILAEAAVGHTPASFIDALPEMNNHLATEIANRFLHSGVRIISTRLLSPDISHEVSAALANIPKARAEAEQAVITAEGEKTRLAKVGEGAASAKLADLTAQAEGKAKMLSAEAKGRKEMKKALGVTGDAVLASETAGSILDKTDVLVMGGDGMKDAMGLVKAAQSALNSGKKGVSS